MQLSQNPITPILKALAGKKSAYNLEILLNDDARVEKLHFKLGGIEVDLSRQLISNEVWSNLLELARQAQIIPKLNELMSGVKVNKSEGRPVTHFNMRSISKRDSKLWGRLTSFVREIRNRKDILDVVNIGIGGSHLGSLTVSSALKAYSDGPNIHYVSNIDPTLISDVLQKCKPTKTIFILNSKSFTTTEVLKNAHLVRDWLKNSSQPSENVIYAVTASRNKAVAWGVNEDNIFDFEEGIGGRYSVWSAVGLPLMLSIGIKHFQEFLNGALLVDNHFQAEDILKNIPIIMSLIRVWNRNFLNYPSHAIIPYDYRLRNFSRYVQQLEMESNGKLVDLEGNTLDMPAGPLIWGEPGTDAQHSFFQFLHQGAEVVPVDILVPKLSSTFEGNNEYRESHKILVANALAQAEALALGRNSVTQPHKSSPGNRPSTIISWEQSSPYNIGTLLALYENITISSGFIWGINSFDQWGVELGKEIAKDLLDNKKLSNFRPQVRNFMK